MSLLLTQLGGGSAWFVTPSDTIFLSDAVVKAVGKPASDTITLSDSSSKAVGKSQSDTISLSDGIAKLFGLNKADTIALSDLISLPGVPVAYSFTLSDTISLSDTSVQVLVSGVPVPTVSFHAQFSGLRIFYEGSVHELSLVSEADAPIGMGGILKIRKDGVNYVVYLVEVNDANASRLRIRTTTGTKAIRLKT